MRQDIIISQSRTLIFEAFTSNTEAFVKFNFRHFVKYFFYHLMFFLVLGPIFSLILIPIEGYKKLQVMGLIGLSSSFFSQIIVYLAGMPNLILYIYFKFYFKNPDNSTECYISLFYEIELIFCWIAIFIRSFIIGARYGYTNEEKIELRKRGFEVPNKVFIREFVITGWRNLTPETLDIEIKYAIVRNEIETNFFYYNSFTLLNNIWLKRLSTENFYDMLESENRFSKDQVKQINSEMYSLKRMYSSNMSKKKDIIAKGQNIKSSIELSLQNKNNSISKKKSKAKYDTKVSNLLESHARGGKAIPNNFIILGSNEEKKQNKTDNVNNYDNENDFDKNNFKENNIFNKESDKEQQMQSIPYVESQGLGREMDHKKYSKILPFLIDLKNEKVKKFDFNKALLKEIRRFKANFCSQEDIKIDNKDDISNINTPDPKYLSKINTLENIENLDVNNNDKKNKLSIHYFRLIRNMAQKMSRFRDSSAIIFKKIDHEKCPEEADLPSYMHRPDLDLFLLDLPARIYIRELILLSKDKIKPYFMYLLTCVIIMHSFIPMFYRWYLGVKVLGENIVEIYLIFINFLIKNYLYLISMLFVEIGGNDFERKKYVLESLSSMITPNKMRIDNIRFRYLPLINIFCPLNLKTWLNMRVLALDIGKRYFKRIELYSSIFLFVYGIITAILLLGIYELLKVLKFEDHKLLYIMGLSESFISFLVLYRMLYLGADINSFFKRHINELNINKSKINDVIQNFHKWRKLNSYVDSHLEKAKDFYYYCILYHQVKSKEQIENDVAIGKVIPNPLHEEQFIEYLKNLCEVYSQIAEEIQVHEEENSLRLLGFKLNNELLAQFYFALLTLVFSLLQKFLDTNSK